MKINRDNVMEGYRRNFYNIYHRRILPILTGYEKERKQKLGLVIVVAIITAILVIPTFLFAMSQDSKEQAEVFMYIPFIIGGIGGWIIYSIRDKFVGDLKSSCMGHIVQVFENLTWIPKVDLISDYEVRNSELFDRYEYRESDDSFKGEYKGVNFQICETDMWRMEGSGKNRRRVTVFKGVLVKFDFNKSINSKTIIRTKIDSMDQCVAKWIVFIIVSFFIIAMLSIFKLPIWITLLVPGVVGILFLLAKNPIGNSAMTELKLEDPEFNKHYRAYSTDQVEGRYLITPAFMERFKHIQTAFGAKGAKCAFYDSHILFALSSNKNLFEIGGLFHSLKDPKQMEEFFNELTSIMRLIDRFKLTEHTGL